MSRKVLILDVAKPDFREIRTYVQSQFGETVWNDVNEEFKTAINDIGLHPAAGKEIEELKELGQENFRIRRVRQTRIIYEYDDKEVLVHMFIHARRDFRTHLMKRLFNV
ncbi:type II toxin-antitoxin system RelE/ParE family toxin [Janthinobacterium sp. 17J80-10]|uniref:type II toxin-antitoxin system RelE/ParE family toxin n=1 Tax=Janthinobacterium sp. 17J80-10 TaxID=2497863 RepID=UPI00100577FE|nr:type II toxin-antitoxin system RelE/ParE family toxin [Janthinobacterium sp. 17J80-10]QAU35113.1 type II toxin-antitoxin system RelE/ParE family toxin [Janthinobacterium sp. 17J80-10]